MKIKSLLAVLLAAVLTLTCTGCAETNDDENLSSVKPLEHSLNILKIAEQGQIPEIPYKLGHDIEDLKNTFMSHIDEGSEIIELGVNEGEKTVWLEGGSMTFCYEKSEKENGISVIVAHEYAQDFAMGVYDADDIIYAVGSEEYERAETTDDDAFFLPATPDNSECIKYKAGKYDLRFIFVDGFLGAVSLTDPEHWDN